jgi:CheY-like chemotaxis protein
VEAATGLEAVHLASTEHPNLIVIDLDLPAMTGDEATAHIKANPPTRDIPVIISTGCVVGERRRHILELGAAGILQKPFSVSTMQDLLHKYLRITGKVAGTEAA